MKFGINAVFKKIVEGLKKTTLKVEDAEYILSNILVIIEYMFLKLIERNVCFVKLMFNFLVYLFTKTVQSNTSCE